MGKLEDVKWRMIGWFSQLWTQLWTQLRKKPEKRKRKKEKKKFSTSTGFEPVTERYSCDALTNEATELIYSIYICHKLEED